MSAELRSNGRAPYWPIPPLTTEIVDQLRADGHEPYIADLAGGCFALAFDVNGESVWAGNGDAWLPDDDRGPRPYGAVVLVAGEDGETDDVVLDLDHPATVAEFMDAIRTAIAHTTKEEA